jgi:hypothetical protein
MVVMRSFRHSYAANHNGQRDNHKKANSRVSHTERVHKSKTASELHEARETIKARRCANLSHASTTDERI